MLNIGQNIRTLRTQKNMSQDDLAEKLFVTRQTVSNYETGRSRPDIEMLDRIAVVLQADIRDLLYEPVVTHSSKKSAIQVAGILFPTLLLGLIIRLIMGYTEQLRITQFRVMPHAIMGYLVLPAYYVLLGWVLVITGRIILNAQPLSASTARWCRLIAAGTLGFYLFCQIPWLCGGISFPKIWFALSYWSARNILSYLWIFLLPGCALGLSHNWNQKGKTR